MTAAYYNEIDPKAAAWLRELIKAGHIAPGEVDERSIEDVSPNDIRRFTQCHFFAGIGVWSYALRQAGWPDDRPVWTGSCPCQPFSSAGKGKGIDDERHLWPAFYWLIQQCHPVEIFGEQVANKNGENWLDFVQNDLENEGYTSGAVIAAACGFGAPHQRKRIYWVGKLANSKRSRLEGLPWDGDRVDKPRRQQENKVGSITESRPADKLVNSNSNRWEQSRLDSASSSEKIEARKADKSGNAEPVIYMGDSMCNGAREGSEQAPKEGEQTKGPKVRRECIESRERGQVSGPYPVNGFWENADWLYCRDGKFRPVESGTFPLVNGAPGRVGLLRGYGNAIVPQQAQAFIEVAMEAKS